MLSQMHDDIGRELDRTKQRDESIGRLLMGVCSSEAVDDGGDHDVSHGHAECGNRHVEDDDIHEESVALACRVWNESSSSSNVSPLMARDPSIACEHSIRLGRPTPSSPTGRPPLSLIDDYASIRQTSNPNNRDLSSSSNYYHNHQKKTDEEESCNNHNTTLVEKYRHFLNRHESSLGIFERLMENFEYYILFRYDNGLNTEVYYTIWNIIRWINDVVLYGWGEGMGTILGTRNELPLLGRNKLSTGKDDDGIISSRRIDLIVRMLRAVLTATSCIHPALNAWCYHSVRFHPRHYFGTSRHALSYDKNDHERREKMELIGGKARAAYVSYKLERIKFVARMALLAISWWTQRQRRRRRKILMNNEVNDTIMYEKSNINCNNRTLIFPMLRGGGELDPHEHVTSLKDMEDEMKVASYVGKRTGRRSVARNYTISSCQPLTLDWLSKLMTRESKIPFVHAVGEFLHILRPLYWSRETSKWRSSATSSYNQQSYSIRKAWFVSLLMDLISDKLLLHAGTASSFEQTKLEQLEMRRRRHRLYLLRSPVYDTITQPLAIVVGKIVSSVPSFGLGRWASDYVLDMMNYWSENHYMLET